MEKKTFDSNIKKISKQSDALAQLIHTTGLAAIELVNKTGDISWGSRLVDALGQKHDKRRVVAWLVRFGKFGWDKEKGLIFRKRKDITLANEAAMLQQASDTPYWVLTPQAQPKVTYDYLAMIKSIVNKADKVENSEKEIEEKNLHVLEALRHLMAGMEGQAV